MDAKAAGKGEESKEEKKEEKKKDPKDFTVEDLAKMTMAEQL